MRDLEFGKYLPCEAFDKFVVAILKILLFGQLMAEKLPKNGGHTHIGFFEVFWQLNITGITTVSVAEQECFTSISKEV